MRFFFSLEIIFLCENWKRSNNKMEERAEVFGSYSTLDNMKEVVSTTLLYFNDRQFEEFLPNMSFRWRRVLSELVHDSANEVLKKRALYALQYLNRSSVLTFNELAGLCKTLNKSEFHVEMNEVVNEKALYEVLSRNVTRMISIIDDYDNTFMFITSGNVTKNVVSKDNDVFLIKENNNWKPQEVPKYNSSIVFHDRANLFTLFEMISVSKKLEIYVNDKQFIRLGRNVRKMMVVTFV